MIFHNFLSFNICELPGLLWGRAVVSYYEFKFVFLKLDTLPRLESQIYPVISPISEEREMDS